MASRVFVQKITAAHWGFDGIAFDGISAQNVVILVYSVQIFSYSMETLLLVSTNFLTASLTDLQFGIGSLDCVEYSTRVR